MMGLILFFTFDLQCHYLESLVASIAEQYDKLDLGASITRNNPLAQSFLEGGATAETVQKVLTRFTSETGKPSNDRVGALSSNDS